MIPSAILSILVIGTIKLLSRYYEKTIIWTIPLWIIGIAIVITLLLIVSVNFDLFIFVIYYILFGLIITFIISWLYYRNLIKVKNKC